MYKKLLTVAAALTLFAVVGKYYAVPAIAQAARAALVQDVDQAARAPFQTTVTVNVNNFTYTPITIPAGKRLVIDQISMNGAAQTNGAFIQPIILVSAGVAGNSAATYYYGPNPSTTTPGQYYAVYPTTIYADTLSLGPAYAGYSPTFDTFNVVITGHLITP